MMHCFAAAIITTGDRRLARALAEFELRSVDTTAREGARDQGMASIARDGLGSGQQERSLDTERLSLGNLTTSRSAKYGHKALEYLGFQSYCR